MLSNVEQSCPRTPDRLPHLPLRFLGELCENRWRHGSSLSLPLTIVGWKQNLLPLNQGVNTSAFTYCDTLYFLTDSHAHIC